MGSRTGFVAVLAASLFVSLFAGCLGLPEELEESLGDGERHDSVVVEPVEERVPGFGSIEGVVLDEDHHPVADAIVLADTGAWTYTDAGGAFLLADIPSGFQPVQAYQRGFAVASGLADVYADETATTTLVLAAGAVEPPAVEVVRIGHVQNQLFLSFHDDEASWRLREGALLMAVHAEWIDGGPSTPLPFLSDDALAMTLTLRRGGDPYGEEIAHDHDGGHADFLLDAEQLEDLEYTAKDEFATMVHAHDVMADRHYELRAVALYALGLSEELPEPAPPSDEATEPVEEPPAAEPYLDVVEFRGRAGPISWFGPMESFAVALAGDERDVVIELEWLPSTPGALPLPTAFEELTLSVAACGSPPDEGTASHGHDGTHEHDNDTHDHDDEDGDGGHDHGNDTGDDNETHHHDDGEDGHDGGNETHDHHDGSHGDGSEASERRCDYLAHASGMSPVRVDLDEATLDALEEASLDELVLDVGSGFLTLQQDYRVVVSLFHGLEAEEGYSGLTPTA